MPSENEPNRITMEVIESNGVSPLRKNGVSVFVAYAIIRFTPTSKLLNLDPIKFKMRETKPKVSRKKEVCHVTELGKIEIVCSVCIFSYDTE